MNRLNQITPSLFCYPDTCNVYLIRRNSRCLFIDFGSGGILNEFNSLGITKPDTVLITHHHRDQLQGLSSLPQKSSGCLHTIDTSASSDVGSLLPGLSVYVPHSESELIANADEMWLSREIMNNYNTRQDRFSSLTSIPIAGTLKDYSVFSWEGLSFYILPTPGHTTGSISILTEIDGISLAFTGDLLYAPGKVWSLAALQWSYNGGEGIPHTILSLLDLKDRGITMLLPSHGQPMDCPSSVMPTVENLIALKDFRRHNPRLLELREKPYEAITEHLLFNRTSMCNSYVLISDTKKAAIFDLGYDFMAGTAAGADRSARRPWLYTIPWLMSHYEIEELSVCFPTHYHDDHVAAFNLLREVYGTQVWCPEHFHTILENPQSFDLPCLWYDPIPVDLVLPSEGSILWEEYDIAIHPIGGHTKYSVCYEFTADDKKVLVTGDEYADDDGLFCNYVYKNLFEPEAFTAFASLYEQIMPDLVLTGHWSNFVPAPNYAAQLKARGTEVEKLHHALLPYEEYRAPSSDFCMAFSPYQITVSPGAQFAFTVTVNNPLVSCGGPVSGGCSLDEQSAPMLDLILPEGFLSLGKEPLSNKKDALTFLVKAPAVPVYRARISCNLIIDGRPLGQQAEMLVTVKAEPDSKG